jgi:hypothetical protein
MLQSQHHQNQVLSFFRQLVHTAKLLRRSARFVGLTQQPSCAQTQTMLEPKRPDARTNLMRHVHQLEIRLLIPAHFGALNQHAQ